MAFEVEQANAYDGTDEFDETCDGHDDDKTDFGTFSVLDGPGSDDNETCDIGSEGHDEVDDHVRDEHGIDSADVLKRFWLYMPGSLFFSTTSEINE